MTHIQLVNNTEFRRIMTGLLLIQRTDSPCDVGYSISLSHNFISKNTQHCTFSVLVQYLYMILLLSFRIYVDAVINHMAAQSDEHYGTGGSKVHFGDWLYPSVPYYSYNFNWPHCIISKEDYKCCLERVNYVNCFYLLNK